MRVEIHVPVPLYQRLEVIREAGQYASRTELYVEMLEKQASRHEAILSGENPEGQAA